MRDRILLVIGGRPPRTDYPVTIRSTLEQFATHRQSARADHQSRLKRLRGKPPPDRKKLRRQSREKMERELRSLNKRERIALRLLRELGVKET